LSGDRTAASAPPTCARNASQAVVGGHAASPGRTRERSAAAAGRTGNEKPSTDASGSAAATRRTRLRCDLGPLIIVVACARVVVAESDAG
jgi:hypothetical protein